MILSRIKKLYLQNKYAHAFLLPFKWVYDIYRFHIESDRSYTKRAFYENHGYIPDLKHPQSLNEKITWLKLYDRSRLHTQCADKLLVRDYVRKLCGEKILIPLLFSTKICAEIAEERLPDYPVIIKSNHNSGGTIIVRDKTKLDFDQIRTIANSWLKQNFYYRSREWQYKNIKPQILVEKLLFDHGQSIPDDYKFHCFHGKVEFVQVDTDRCSSHKRDFFSTSWIKLPFSWYPKEKVLLSSEKNIKKPANFDEMIKIAENLSNPFIYARIDLYNIAGQIFFGEITLHPGSGNEIFSPSVWDKKMGSLLNLPVNE